VREASELSISPSSDYHASPASDADLFEWHFTLRGPPSSPFASGIYHGRIVLPPTYPLRPPSFRFLTPSGRFETNREICLSISGHHEETWQPAWGIRTALVALRAFMETDAKGQLGGLDTSEAERRRCAESSISWKCAGCGKSNGDILKECSEAAKEKEAQNGEGSSNIEETVPPELKIGFKPDVPKNVEVSPQAAEQPVVSSESATPRESYPPARPAQGVPQPTRTTVSSRSPTTRTDSPRNLQRGANVTLQAAGGQQERVSNDGVTVWIDRAIAGIVICLVFMVTKVMLGL
jgi:ubiquitin-conjugating enzyme E2 J1